MTTEQFRIATLSMLILIVTLLLTGCAAFDSRNSGGKNWGEISYNVGKVVDNGGSQPRSDI